MHACANAIQVSPALLSPACETKRATLAVTQASEAGVFEGYASLFDIVDSGGDLVMPGAFAASLRKRGPAGVKMLWQHKASEPIGVWTGIAEDARGLKVKGQLDLSVARAREALSLLRSGAVDGLSIGFRTRRATSDRRSGVRRLLEVDLWEISIVTFPMLAQARIEAVKRRRPRRPAPIDVLTMKLARLRAHRAAEAFETKLRLLSHALERRYSPNQPRDDIGRWTSGGGAGVQSAFNVDPNVAGDAGGPIKPTHTIGGINLREEVANGGHAIEEHVGKSDEYLKHRVRDSRFELGPFQGTMRAGSFYSLEAADKLVNSTIDKNEDTVNLLASGALGEGKTIRINAWFDSITGKEAYAPTPRAQPEIRATSGVAVVLRHVRSLARGFIIVSAYPVNP